MTLVAIIGATLAAGIGSVWIAAGLLRLGLGGRWRVGPQHLLSLAAGALLATAFMHLLPEAFEGGASVESLFATLLLGLVFFFVLEKAELWHHGHEHGDAHEHEHEHSHDHGHHHHPHHGGGGWALITGDSVHCFGDGVLIASAFVADMRLGLVAALSVLAHEVPHHVGDLVVLSQRGAGRKAALMKVSLAGAVSVLGGLAGYFVVEQWEPALPYFLTIASSSFIYVALADLIPQLQKRLSATQTLAQIAWLGGGIAAVTLVSLAAHVHVHVH
ncbi:ZIP family metal transporter [Pulveribacter sp.]|uniref:ZIP family metal transporter n=1 Tax=Pulveribacter sp. TaxID=2678893 RepID=UPI0028A72710|nr:ZIP family metal transporter [Pulveribacter sp.]